jgi:hypothetical protein
MYKKAKASFWTEEELDLDLHNWTNHLVLVSFTMSDGIVNENLVEWQFSNEVRSPLWLPHNDGEYPL